jgi:hypothetical protein
MNVIKKWVNSIRKGKNVNFKLWSYAALVLGVSFLMGAPGNTNILPIILIAAVLSAGAFVLLQLFDKIQKEQIIQEKLEKKEKEEQERLEKKEKAPQELIAEYKKALDAADSYIDVSLSPFENKYKPLIGEEHFRDIIHNVMKERYFEGDEKTHKFLVTILDFCLEENVVKSFGSSYREDLAESYYIAENQAVAITLRALHFEKHRENKNSYQSITNDNLHEFFLQNDYFQGHYSEDRATRITKVLNFITVRSDLSIYLPTSTRDPYYIDSLCNSYLRSCFRNHSRDVSLDPNYIFNGLYNHFKPNEDDCKKIKAAKHRKEIYRQQCSACAFYDRCQLPYANRTLNCSGFIPK